MSIKRQKVVDLAQLQELKRQRKGHKRQKFIDLTAAARLDVEHKGHKRQVERVRSLCTQLRHAKRQHKRQKVVDLCAVARCASCANVKRSQTSKVH